MLKFIIMLSTLILLVNLDNKDKNQDFEFYLKIENMLKTFIANQSVQQKEFAKLDHTESQFLKTMHENMQNNLF